jgi:hypothetical protein
MTLQKMHAPHSRWLIPNFASFMICPYDCSAAGRVAISLHIRMLGHCMICSLQPRHLGKRISNHQVLCLTDISITSCNAPCTILLYSMLRASTAAI